MHKLCLPTKYTDPYDTTSVADLGAGLQPPPCNLKNIKDSLYRCIKCQFYTLQNIIIRTFWGLHPPHPLFHLYMHFVSSILKIHEMCFKSQLCQFKNQIAYSFWSAVPNKTCTFSGVAPTTPSPLFQLHIHQPAVASYMHTPETPSVLDCLASIYQYNSAGCFPIK